MPSYRIVQEHDLSYRLGWTYNEMDELSEITDKINEIILKDIIQNEMQVITILVWGARFSGKTHLCRNISYVIWSKFGEENTTISYTNNLTVAYSELDAKPVQVLVIDDAARHQGSQDGVFKEKKDMLNDWRELRHLKEKKVPDGKTGIVIVMLNFQKYSTIHSQIRNDADITLILSPSSDFSDVTAIKQRIGDLAYERLKENKRKILKGDNSVRSQSIAYLPAYGYPDGVGIYVSDWVNEIEGAGPNWTVWPDKMEPQKEIKSSSGKRTTEEIIDELLNDLQWRKRTEIYLAYKEKKRTKETQAEIADRFMVSSQGMVSWYVSKVEEEIIRRGGNIEDEEETAG